MSTYVFSQDTLNPISRCRTVGPIYIMLACLRFTGFN